MLLPLIILFTTVPIIELFLIIQVHGMAESVWGSSQALMFTFGSILLTGIVGAAVAKNQGFQIIKKAQDSLSQGIVPGDALVEGLLVVFGGVLLLTPGYVSDLLGFSMILPLTRPLIAIRITEWFQEKLADGSIQVSSDAQGFYPPEPRRSEPKNRKPADVIDITAYQNFKKGSD